MRPDVAEGHAAVQGAAVLYGTVCRLGGLGPSLESVAGALALRKCLTSCLIDTQFVWA